MKLTHYIYISTALATLAACSDDDLSQRGFTVGEADNAIVLQAGVSEGGSGVQTRAGSTIYSPFSAQTQLRLRVDGTWTGHGAEPYLVSKSATAKTAASATIDTDTDGTKDTHAIEYTTGEELYWDDYGTADPANSSTGRTTGLTIYGVAVEGGLTAPAIDGSAGTSWNNLSWNVGVLDSEIGVIDQSGNDYWKKSDLLTSNNVTVTGADGTYKFDARADGKLLKFTHAMSKMTVELRAGVGFTGSTFKEVPSVILKGFHYKGKVNIEDKSSTPDSEKTNIKMHLASGGKDANNAVFDALVFPHDLTETADVFADTDEILTLTADGNTYVVTATNLNAAIEKAINDKTTSGYPSSVSTKHLLQGWNYKLVIIVNKTEIKVIATVVDWKDVTADEEAPKINVTKSYGHTGTAFENNFDFFRSTNKASDYSNDAYIEYNTTDGKYVWHDQLYWPTHSTHYFFRGVWPRVEYSGKPDTEPCIPTDKVDASKIKVQNVAYVSGTYPSDLMMARPLESEADNAEADETCKVAAHKTGDTASEGICATEGEIRMNFRYMMSKVEVNLVNATEAIRQVNLDGAKVELVNVYNEANMMFGTCQPEFSGDQKMMYILDQVSGEGNQNKRLSAIIPQNLTYSTSGAETNLRFKVTIYKSGSTEEIDDIYYADVNPILKYGSTTEKVAPNGKWEAGKYYKYTLTMSKTAIKVSATLTDWIPVEANQDVWF